MNEKFKPGDPVIYTMPKNSTRPGPRARQVSSAPHGDTYNYYVPKFWRVKSVDDRGRLVLVTRTGKQHVLESSDPNLKKPGLLTRVLYRGRFPCGVSEHLTS